MLLSWWGLSCCCWRRSLLMGVACVSTLLEVGGHSSFKVALRAFQPERCHLSFCTSDSTELLHSFRAHGCFSVARATLGLVCWAECLRYPVMESRLWITAVASLLACSTAVALLDTLVDDKPAWQLQEHILPQRKALLAGR